MGGGRIFTDVNVTYGHSGAPAFDAMGRVMGIVRGELTVGNVQTDLSIIVPIERASLSCPR